MSDKQRMRRIEMEKMTNLAQVMGWEVTGELVTNTSVRIVLEMHFGDKESRELERKEMEGIFPGHKVEKELEE